MDNYYSVLLRKRYRSLLSSAAIAVITVFGMPAQAQISFDEVFASPENAQLNLDYAKQEAAAGNLLQAASTLERLLYAEPNWDSARLFYTYVLIQLDDRQGAAREAKLLDGRPLSTTQRSELAKYNAVLSGKTISASAGDSGVSGRVSLGVRYDDNGANALTDVVNPSTDEDDLSLVASIAVDGRHALTTGVKLIGGISARHRAPSEKRSKSYSDFGINAGLAGEAAGVDWAARLGARTINLDGEEFLTEIGPRAALGYKLSELTRLDFAGAAVYQDYKSLSSLPNERFRSGQKYSLSAGVTHKASAKTRYGANIGYDLKNAKSKIFAYDAWRLSGNIFHTLNEDRYLRGDLSYRMVDYDGINGFVTPPVARDDDQIYARAAYGIRLNSVLPALGVSDRVFVEGALDLVDRDSNINAFDYDNIGAQLSLNWEF